MVTKNCTKHRKNLVKYLRKVLLLLFTLAMIAGISMAQDDVTIAENVQNLAGAEDAQFSILLNLLESTDLTDSLDDEDSELTVFAPTDAAFENLLDEMGLDLGTLLEDVELLTSILLYHVADGMVLSSDLEDGQKIETLQSGSITVSIDDETITLDDIAEIAIADILASNGVIHVIDNVLLPPIPDERFQACFVSTDTFNAASVHVGPGNNRTSVTFLEVDVEYEALGQNEDGEGVIWYQLDKEEVAPGRAINEAWVSSDEVDTTGDCDNIGETSAPPIIPITNRPPETPEPQGDNSSQEPVEESEPVDTANTGTRPLSGTYSVGLAEFTNASCAGGRNIPIPSNEFWTTTLFSIPISTTATSMSFGGDLLSFGGGVYNGQVLFEGEYYTTTVYPANAGFFTGTIIVSFVSGGLDCSGTVNFSATRQ